GQPMELTRDGRSVLWGREGVIYLHTEGGRDSELALHETLQDASFSHDGRRFAVVTKRSIGVWELDGLRPVFRIDNPSSAGQEIYWSLDDSALRNKREEFGTLLIDSRTGHPFANVLVTKPGAARADDILSPDLRTRISR